VRRGDTLYSIAWQHDLSVGELAALNAIRPPYTIYTGQRLRVRPDGKPLATGAPRAAPLPAAKPLPATRSAPGSAAKPVVKPAAKPQPASTPEPVLPAVVKHWVWPAKGPLLNGYRPDTAGRKGIEIGGRNGQSVQAAAAGKVVYSGSGLVGYGRLIIIKHNDSLLSAYGHNSKLLVSEGDYVNTGQAIATMGSSGTDRTHLYFEIRKNGRPVNPLGYLPGG
jgi:lipoprotein NlpD